jgi:RNA polymerase sigma-70 factor (ECF subfamily)
MKPDDSPALGDGALLIQLVDGKATALERLYDRHAGALYALALRIAASPEKAESAVEATFSDLWSLRQSLVASGTAVAPALWLMTRCRARALESSAQAPNADRDLPVRVVSERRIEALLALDPGQRGDRVRRALEALPAPQRAAVERAYFDGATLAQIARDQGLTPRDVARDLKQGLVAIAAGLGGPARERSAG